MVIMYNSKASSTLGQITHRPRRDLTLQGLQSLCYPRSTVDDELTNLNLTTPFYLFIIKSETISRLLGKI